MSPKCVQSDSFQVDVRSETGEMPLYKKVLAKGVVEDIRPRPDALLVHPQPTVYRREVYVLDQQLGEPIQL